MILKMIEEKYDSKKICPIFCTNDIWDDIRNPNSFKFNYSHNNMENIYYLLKVKTMKLTIITLFY